jgi:hypothetical protein
VVRFVSSGLHVFTEDIQRHRHNGPCSSPRPLLPVPATGGWR